MDSKISQRPLTYTAIPEKGMMGKLADLLRGLVGKPTASIEPQLYIYDYKKGQHIATGLSGTDLTLLKEAKLDNKEALEKADTLLKAAGYNTGAKNALPEQLRITTAQLLAEGKVDLKWADDYAKAVRENDQGSIVKLMNQAVPNKATLMARSLAYQLKEEGKVNEKWVSEYEQALNKNDTQELNRLLKQVNQPDPVYGDDPIFLGHTLDLYYLDNQAHLKDFDWGTSLALRISKDAFRNDGTLFMGALSEAKAEITSNRDYLPMLKTPHTSVVVKRLNELIDNKDGLRDKLMAIEGPKNQRGPMANIIRETLGLHSGSFVTDAHARQAALSGLLSELRQDEGVGSCFATSTASMILESHSALFLEDFAHMCEHDTLPICSGTATRYVPVNPHAPAPENPESAALVGPKRNRTLDAWQYTIASSNKMGFNERVRDEICSGFLGYGSAYRFAKEGTSTEGLFQSIDKTLKDAGVKDEEIPVLRRVIIAQIEFILRGQIRAEYDPTIERGKTGSGMDTQSTMGGFRLKQVSVEDPHAPHQEIQTIEQLQKFFLETVHLALEDPIVKEMLPEKSTSALLEKSFTDHILSDTFAADFSNNIKAYSHCDKYLVEQGALVRVGGENTQAILESYLGLEPNALDADAQIIGKKDYNGQKWEDINLTSDQAYGYGLEFIESIINGLKNAGAQNTDKSYVCSGFGHAFRICPGLDESFWQSALVSKSTEDFVTEHVHDKIEAFNTNAPDPQNPQTRPIDVENFKTWVSNTLTALGIDSGDPQHAQILAAALEDFENVDPNSCTPWGVIFLLDKRLPEAQKKVPGCDLTMQTLFMKTMNPPKVVFADSNWKEGHANTYYSLVYNPFFKKIEFWDTTPNDHGEMTLVNNLGDDWLKNEYTLFAPKEIKRTE